MVLRIGVTEVADSEEESMTSSPVEVSNPVPIHVRIQFDAIPSSKENIQARGCDPKVPIELDCFKTEEQDKNLDQTPFNDSLAAVDTTEDDRLANAQSSDHVQQLDADFSYTVPSEERSHELDSANDLTKLRKEEVQMDGTEEADSSLSQQTSFPGQVAETKRETLEQPATSFEPVPFETRNTAVNSVQDREYLHSQMDDLEPSAAKTAEFKHEPIVTMQHGDSNDRPQQLQALQDDLSGVEKRCTTDLPVASTKAEHEDFRPLHVANEPDMKQQTQRILNAPVEGQQGDIRGDINSRVISEPRTVPTSSEPSLDVIQSNTQSSAQKPEPPDLPSSPSKPSTTPKHPNPKKTSQETTLAELRAQRAALLASLAALPNVQDRMDDTVWQSADAEPADADIMTVANRIVKDHIKLLHEYNEIKDVGQGLMGLIADQRGVRIVEVQEEFGIGDKD